MKIYLVGGAVRDKLLNQPVQDRDWVVVGATVDEMLKLGYRQVGKDFPVFLHPETKEEYALARTERKTAKGYHGFEFNAAPDVTLEQDLERRDLTINAMAESLNGELIDPFNGRQDLDNGLLKHVSPAFAEDPVRLLRIARFAARFHRWGFRVAHETNRLMRQIVKQGEVDSLVPERVWSEIRKALAEPHPHRFFEVLAACHALGILLPELSALFESMPPAKAHAEKSDTAYAMQVLIRIAQIENKALTRLSVFLLALIYHHQVTPAFISTLDSRWKWDKQYKTLVNGSIKHYPAVHTLDFQQAEPLLELFYNCNAFRNSELFKHIVYCCTLYDEIAADSHSAQNKIKNKIKHNTADTTKNKALQKTNRLINLAQACSQLNAADITDTTLSGPALGKAIRNLRLLKLKDLLSEKKS